MSGEPAGEDAFERLAQHVGETDAGCVQEARRALSAHPGYGRLADLAVWWAGVRGSPGAAPPSRVWLVRAGPKAGPTPDPTQRVTGRSAGARVSRRRLAAPDDVRGAIAAGRDLADQAADSGVDLLLVSLADPWGARAVSAALLDLDPVEATGWPRPGGDGRVDDPAWAVDVARLRDALRRGRPRRGEPTALLEALGTPVLAGAAAVLLQSAARRTPVILDGAGATVAALFAARVTREARAWWQAALAATAPATERALTGLGLSPLLELGVEVEDGTGALLALGIVRTAALLLDPAGEAGA